MLTSTRRRCCAEGLNVPSNTMTLQELRQRAEYLKGKMHGGSLMVCDAYTLLAALDGLAAELEAAITLGSDYFDGQGEAYRAVARRLRGLDAKL